MSENTENKQNLTKIEVLAIKRCFKSSETIVLNTLYPRESGNDKLQMVFKICDFHLLKMKNGECVRSSTFTMEKNPNIQWSLSVYPNGRTNEYDGCLGVYLNLITTDPKMSVPATFEISLLNVNKDNNIKNFRRGRTFDWKDRGWGIAKFIEIRNLLNNPDFLPNNALTILCSVETEAACPNSWVFSNPEKIINVDFDQDEEDSSPSKKMKIEEALNIVKNPFEIMFEEKCFYDVVLIVEDNKIKAHKCVLATASPIFTKMFKENANQGINRAITMSDLSFKVATELLRFIYTKKVENLDDVAHDLLKAAHKYEIPELGNICEKSLCKNINLTNALKFLRTVKAITGSTLKECVLDFIAKNRESFSENKEFKAVVKSDPELMELLFDKLVSLN